ncbi:hypothetical protein BLOT_014163 [Blomia tropicalis]|nr:hypothetical protein BLOT_014163 [Blomia tropicalis]
MEEMQLRQTIVKKKKKKRNNLPDSISGTRQPLPLTWLTHFQIYLMIVICMLENCKLVNYI